MPLREIPGTAEGMCERGRCVETHADEISKQQAQSLLLYPKNSPTPINPASIFELLDFLTMLPIATTPNIIDLFC
jgi:hypothetical protein